MSANDPSRFDQPIGTRVALLAGEEFSRTAFERVDSAAGQAHYLVTGAGRAAIQYGYTSSGSSIVPQLYTWAQAQQISRESEVRLIDRLSRSDEVVLWVPMTVETEVFTLAGGGAESFTLARSEARSAEPLFPSTSQYPHKAWIDGTEKTVVTGSPADASEVQITGTTAAVTGAVAGQRLEVRYYAAYSVVVRQSAYRFGDQYDQGRAVELLEV